jgi:protein required for attachment to host cells
LKIQHDTWLVIADGEKFLMLRNVGDAKYVNLEVIEKETSPNEPTREIATDRPGRRYDAGRSDGSGVAPFGKSGMEPTDWHEIEEERFAKELAEKLHDWAVQGRFERLIIVADPDTLGTLRQAYSDQLKAKIEAEIDKDLTNLPMEDIEKSISKYAEA